MIDPEIPSHAFQFSAVESLHVIGPPNVFLRNVIIAPKGRKILEGKKKSVNIGGEKTAPMEVFGGLSLSTLHSAPRNDVTHP